MKSVRIYKDDIRINILRSLFFTDTTLVISGAVIIAGLFYLLYGIILHIFTWSLYVSSVFITEIGFLSFITQKIDNQPIYKVIPRGITFTFRKKKLRHKELEPYFIDFTIQDNLIVRTDSIAKVLEIDPYDISLLNDQDRDHFFTKMKQALHILPSQIQIIVKKERTTEKDLSSHFFSIYNQSDQSKEPYIDRYINDLTNLINTNAYFTTHYYAVMTVSCDPKNNTQKLKAVKKLNDNTLRFISSMSACGITGRPLLNDDLIQFVQSIII